MSDNNEIAMFVQITRNAYHLANMIRQSDESCDFADHVELNYNFNLRDFEGLCEAILRVYGVRNNAPCSGLSYE